MPKVSYTVRRPLMDGPESAHQAGIVSRHHKLQAAYRALARQQRGAVKQGGYSDDFLYDETERCPVGHEAY